MSGLATLKQCLAEGFTVSCVESRDQIGGQWQYEAPDPVTGKAFSSMYRSVVIQSVRDVMGFSDFPMDPARYAEYTSHAKVAAYLNEYAEYFGLKQYVRLNTTVLSSKQLNYGRWKVNCQKKGDKVVVETYDAIFACTGHHSVPLIPEFKDIEVFKGKVFHSHIYRTPDPYADRKIAIIGLGNTGTTINMALILQPLTIYHRCRYCCRTMQSIRSTLNNPARRMDISSIPTRRAFGEPQ